MKINICGFTSMFNGNRNVKGIITLPDTLIKILKEMGHEADYGLESPDLNIVFVFDVRSMAASGEYTLKALQKLRDEKCILAFNDWDIRTFYHNVDKLVHDNTYKFTTVNGMTRTDILEYRDELLKISEGEYPVLFHAYKTGDHELLGIRGDKKWFIDESVYVEKERIVEQDGLFAVETKHELLPVHASLTPKWNFLKEKNYSLLNLRNVTEDKVFEYLCKHRICLLPPYYHQGGGWFRNRYALANLARAVVVEDENSPFGPNYEVARKDVDEKNIESLFVRQNHAFQNNIMSKSEIYDVLENMLNDVL
jgi:hypothetical protein